MKKIVKLTERDLTRIVRRVISEADAIARVQSLGKDNWLDSDDRMINRPNLKRFPDEKRFGPNDYEDFMEYINDCDTEWCIKTKKILRSIYKRRNNNRKKKTVTNSIFHLKNTLIFE
jgi:hypothetical protein